MVSWQSTWKAPWSWLGLGVRLELPNSALILPTVRHPQVYTLRTPLIRAAPVSFCNQGHLHSGVWDIRFHASHKARRSSSPLHCQPERIEWEQPAYFRMVAKEKLPFLDPVVDVKGEIKVGLGQHTEFLIVQNSWVWVWRRWSNYAIFWSLFGFV